MLFTKSTDSGRFWLIRGDCELVDEEIWWTGIFPLTLPLAPLSLSQSQDVLTFKFSPGHFQENIRDLALQANLLLESIKALNLLFYCTMNDNYGGHSWISRVFLPTHNAIIGSAGFCQWKMSRYDISRTTTTEKDWLKRREQLNGGRNRRSVKLKNNQQCFVIIGILN